ncbi:hypothetical protein [Streptomyces phytohabitans]|uniref:hypothetical protein n=1 Tax=Streptomyces phytohabitans TaxID=1150371 RepID=UPI00345B61DE
MAGPSGDPATYVNLMPLDATTDDAPVPGVAIARSAEPPVRATAVRAPPYGRKLARTVRVGFRLASAAP